MFFDPISSWLILLVDGTIFAKEKFGSNSTSGEHEQECIVRHNRNLNEAIRNVMKSDGISTSAYQKIQAHIDCTTHYYPFNHSQQYIRLDPDTRDYFICVLDFCVSFYTAQSNTAKGKVAEQSKVAAEDARRKKEHWEFLRMKEEKEREESQKPKKYEFKEILSLLLEITAAVILLFLLKSLS